MLVLIEKEKVGVGGGGDFQDSVWISLQRERSEGVSFVCCLLGYSAITPEVYPQDLGRAQKLCGSRGGYPGLPPSSSNKPCGFCGRKATWNRTQYLVRM